MTTYIFNIIALPGGLALFLLGLAVIAWIMSLSGLQGDSFLVRMFKPSALSPLLGTIGIIIATNGIHSANSNPASTINTSPHARICWFKKSMS